MLKGPSSQLRFTMRRVLCFVGFHRWEHHVSREKSGPGGGYDMCSRCGREKKSYEGGGNPSFKGPLIG